MSEENEHLTDTEMLKLQQRGTSKGFTIPSHWLKTLPELKSGPIIFAAHIEKDRFGAISIIITKVKGIPTEILPDKRRQKL